MWSRDDPSVYFIDQRRLAEMPDEIKKPFARHLFSVPIFAPMVVMFTTVVDPRTDGIGPFLWSLALLWLIIEFCRAVSLLRLDRKHRIVRNHWALILLVSWCFVFPIAASIKSIFCRTIDSNTGEWIHCFDLPFLIFVYAPVHFTYLGIFHAICIKPVLLAYYDNYADTLSKEGRVFLNYWNWDSSRHRLPSIDDYDVKGKMTKRRRRPLYYFVVDEDVLDSIENNRARKGFAINATLSLIFGSFSGLLPVLLGFGFDHIITIVFFALCSANYVLFVYFSAKLVWLQSKYHAFKNTVALWVSFLFGAGVAAVFSIAGYFNTVNTFNEEGKLMVHLIDGATLLGFLPSCALYIAFVYCAYLNPFLRHYGKRG